MRRFNGTGCWLLLFSLAFGSADVCGLWTAPTPNVSFTEDLSGKDRLRDFEKAWKAIRDNYYDPDMNGVNWDEVHQRYRPLVEAATTDQDFYSVMQHMAGELHDAHTNVLDPVRAENFKKHQSISLGFVARELDGNLVITEVEAGSPAEQAGIVQGTLVQTIDGKTLVEKLAENAAKISDSSTDRATHRRLYSSVLGGLPGTTVKLGLQRPDGSSFEATLTRAVDPWNTSVTAKLLPSGNAYLSFEAFRPPVAKEFTDALQKFHEAPGLIIDLRGNPGGSNEEVKMIARNFFNKKTVFETFKLRTRDTRPVYIENENGTMYSGPVVILVSQDSGSASELFTSGMQDTGRAKVVGSQTCGCVLGVFNPVDLKGGGLVMISRTLFFTPSGRRLEGEGVIPDKIVIPTLSDIVQKRDPVLAAGDQLLKELSAAGARAEGRAAQNPR